MRTSNHGEKYLRTAHNEKYYLIKISDRQRELEEKERSNTMTIGEILELKELRRGRNTPPSKEITWPLVECLNRLILDKNREEELQRKLDRENITDEENEELLNLRKKRTKIIDYRDIGQLWYSEKDLTQWSKNIPVRQSHNQHRRQILERHERSCVITDEENKELWRLHEKDPTIQPIKNLYTWTIDDV
jgi:CHAT domain-containing protein